MSIGLKIRLISKGSFLPIVPQGDVRNYLLQYLIIITLQWIRKATQNKNIALELFMKNTKTASESSVNQKIFNMSKFYTSKIMDFCKIYSKTNLIWFRIPLIFKNDLLQQRSIDSSQSSNSPTWRDQEPKIDKFLPDLREYYDKCHEEYQDKVKNFSSRYK